MLVLRTARPEETGWINEQYARAGFIPSDASDQVVIAELDGERAGIGRLVDAGGTAYELGGMYVLDRFRGAGIARAIVEELLRRAGDLDVYCIPFADLEAFYASAGFHGIEAVGVPQKIIEKLEWCEREIARAVILMKRIRP
ncbi:MAG TPA: GNAT family N-acetyltransferase [Thermoanaerobaculia bacterium]|nr:GNAT family N-acetyltransferase [Thermoanaerobaculia bacterium]